MQKQNKVMALLVGVLLVLGITPTAFAQFTPAISASDQDAIDGNVVVKIASANGPSWVVIHADDGGNPGPVIGQVAVPQGVSMDVVVPIDLDGATDTLHAMLHDDLGTEGEYEFPGPDAPTTVNDTVVMMPFQLTGQSSSIVGAAVEAGTFTTLLAAVDAAGLTSTLMSEGPLTVFAPTDEAFAQIPQDQLDALLADKDALVQVLTYHVMPGLVLSADLADGMTATTVEGEDVTFSVQSGEIRVNGALIGPADIEADNGVIHVIDQVILPPSMAAAAPAEEAPAAEEVAASEEVTATEEVAASAEVTETTEVAATEEVTETTEVAASEEVTATEEAAATETSTEAASGDLVDTAIAGEFKTLVAALEAASLVDALKGEGPFTVFAPSEEAFAKIPKETLDGLLADPQGLLTQILLYHVAPGNIMSGDITDGLTADTLQGSQLRFSVVDGAVVVEGAKVVAVDIPATNGVIHVIDTVLIPANTASGSSETATESAPAETSTEAAPETAPVETSSEAPTEVPQTGASDNVLLVLLVVGAVLSTLAAGAYVTRNRAA